MSDPEIARRCHQCGASVRAVATFCPQCGRPMEQRKAEADHSATVPLISQGSTSVELAETVAIDPYVTQPLNREGRNDQNKKPKSDASSNLADDVSEPQKNSATTAAEPEPTVAPKDRKATSPVQPQVTVARDDGRAATLATRPSYGTPVSGGQQPMGRAEKLRKASNVVIDQAGYDPSFRFLIIAGVLFLLFLILLIWSKVLN